MAPTVKWKCISGDELIDAYLESAISELIPLSSGLYVWRRRIVYDQECVSTPESCSEWLQRLVDKPSAVLHERALSHCVTLQGLTMGGGGLSVDKEKALSLVTEHRKMRERVVAIMASLTIFTPPIYIGETNNLRSRVQDHLGGKTGLKGYVEKELELRWPDLEFHYHELSSTTNTSIQAKRVQELLEFLAQRTLAPFGTVRPG